MSSVGAPAAQDRREPACRALTVACPAVPPPTPSPLSVHVVYINTSLRTKALAHALVPTITCTSSNVVQTVLTAFAQVGAGGRGGRAGRSARTEGSAGLQGPGAAGPWGRRGGEDVDRGPGRQQHVCTRALQRHVVSGSK